MRARSAVLALAVLALAGCEKPTPGVTISAGSASAHIESTTFCRDGQTPAKKNCVEHLTRLGVINVKQGQLVGIDVDNAIAKHGWVVVDVGQKLTSGVQHEHYFSYTPSFSAGPTIELDVKSLDRVADNANVTGIWRFELRLS